MTGIILRHSHYFIIFASILYTVGETITTPIQSTSTIGPNLSKSTDFEQNHMLMPTDATIISKHQNRLITSLSIPLPFRSHSIISPSTQSSIALPLIASMPTTTMSSISSTIPATKSNLQNDLYIGPYLDDARITNITVQIGTSAYLPCKVKQLGNKSVSWVRVRDDHILSVDRMTFIADERFQAHFKETSNQWILQVKYVQPRDIGLYECQVSTEPKVSARAYLHVVVPRTELIGNADQYVKTGSAVHLQCIIFGAIEPTTYIMWYHDALPILADNKLGYKMHLIKGNGNQNNDANKYDGNELVPSPFDSLFRHQHSAGSLFIESANKYHTGNYTCKPSNSVPATVSLHVLSGESSASPVKSSAVGLGALFAVLSSCAVLQLIALLMCSSIRST